MFHHLKTFATDEAFQQTLNQLLEKHKKEKGIELCITFDNPKAEWHIPKIEMLINFLKRTTCLIDICIDGLSGYFLYRKSVKALIVTLNEMPNLRKLKINKSFLDDGLTKFSKIFATNTTVQCLNISQVSSVSMIQQENHLSSLSLSFQTLFQEITTLSSLNLSGAGLGEMEIATFQTICSIKNLERLFLDDNSLDDSHMPHIISAVSTNSSLRELSLVDNLFNTGIIDLARTLETDTHLRYFSYYLCPFSDSYISSFIWVLQKNTALRRLNLKAKHFLVPYTNTILNHFKAAIEKNYTIEHIKLSKTFEKSEIDNYRTKRNRNNRKQKKKTLFQLLLPTCYPYASRALPLLRKPKKRW